MNRKAEGAVVYNGRSWQFYAKILNEDGSTKYIRRKGFATEQEAIETYRVYETAYETARSNNEDKLKAKGSMLFDEYLPWWLNEIFYPRVEKTTYMLASYVIKNLILPNIDSGIELRLLNVEYLDDLLLRISKMSDSAGNKSREILGIALKDAVAQGYISRNLIKDTRTYPRKVPEVRIYTKEKLKVFLKEAAKSGWYLEILIILFCGLRKGEMMGLKFSDIDMGKGIVHIQRQVTSNPVMKPGTSAEYGTIEKKPKTPNSDRILHLPPVIIRELSKRLERIDGYKNKSGIIYEDHDYVSCQKNGMPHSMSAFNIALRKICKRCGLEPITVHGLRHQYATILAEQGVSLPRISALLGHASVTTTFEYYIGMMDEENRIIDFINTSF